MGAASLKLGDYIEDFDFIILWLVWFLTNWHSSGKIMQLFWDWNDETPTNYFFWF